MNKAPLGKSFLFGILFGLLTFWIYLSCTSDKEDMAEGCGWLFFWPQYPVAFVARLIGLETLIGSLRFAAAALYYGYIFISIRLAPKIAAAWFVISGGLFLIWSYLMISNGAKHGLFLAFIFWPASIMKASGCDIFLQWMSVSVIYTTFGCGIRTLFVLLKGKTPRKEAELSK